MTDRIPVRTISAGDYCTNTHLNLEALRTEGILFWTRDPYIKKLEELAAEICPKNTLAVVDVHPYTDNGGPKGDRHYFFGTALIPT